MGLTTQKAALVYWQHYVKHEEEFSSFDEALSHAVYLESYMAGAPERITDGARVVEGEELSSMIYERERAKVDAWTR